MKYASLFGIAAALFVAYAAQNRGVSLVLLWPATSFAAVAVAYIARSTAVFGKRSDGTITLWSMLLLLPFLVYVWLVWHLVRLTSREPSSHELLPNVRIGRRLLPAELDANVTLIVDLTCEFNEPLRNRQSREYWAFPVLDAFIPTEKQIVQWACAIAAHQGMAFIHCAQGHGRTGTLAAVLLLIKGIATTSDEAIAKVQQARPLLRLNTVQQRFVDRVANMMFGGIAGRQADQRDTSNGGDLDLA
jgi:protein-tyrosine phosphatase